MGDLTSGVLVRDCDLHCPRRVAAAEAERNVEHEHLRLAESKDAGVDAAGEGTAHVRRRARRERPLRAVARVDERAGAAPDPERLERPARADDEIQHALAGRRQRPVQIRRLEVGAEPDVRDELRLLAPALEAAPDDDVLQAAAEDEGEQRHRDEAHQAVRDEKGRSPATHCAS